MKPSGPATLPPDPGFGRLRVMRAYRRDPIGVLRETARRCGDIATFRMGPYRLYPVNHPDLIQDVLVTNARKFQKGRVLQGAKALLGEGLLTSEEPLHLRQRRLAQGAFHPRRLDGYADVLAGLAARHADRWRDGETVDMALEMQRLTLDGVTRTLFGADLGDADAATITSALADAMAIFDFLTLPAAKLLLRSPLPKARSFRRARSELEEVVNRVLAARRVGDEDRDDLLSIFLLARDSADPSSRMTDRQLRDESISMMVAGHETTAHALAWTWLMLDQNPDVEADLHAELENVLAGRTPERADLPRLEICGRVVLETLRLYPPGWALPRLAIEEHALAGYPIRPGSIVVICLPLVHRDPRWWRDPDRFDLGRWAPDLRAERPRYAYLPFGAGPRMCIGHDFAFTEAVTVLATLVQRWRARLVPDHPVEVQTRFTLRPKHGLRMKLERRER